MRVSHFSVIVLHKLANVRFLFLTDAKRRRIDGISSSSSQVSYVIANSDFVQLLSVKKWNRCKEKSLN